MPNTNVKAPSLRQLKLLRTLAMQTGTSFCLRPNTSWKAHQEIERLLALKDKHRAHRSADTHPDDLIGEQHDLDNYPAYGTAA